MHYEPYWSHGVWGENMNIKAHVANMDHASHLVPLLEKAGWMLDALIITFECPQTIQRTEFAQATWGTSGPQTAVARLNMLSERWRSEFKMKFKHSVFIVSLRRNTVPQNVLEKFPSHHLCCRKHLSTRIASRNPYRREKRGYSIGYAVVVASNDAFQKWQHTINVSWERRS